MARAHCPHSTHHSRSRSRINKEQTPIYPMFILKMLLTALTLALYNSGLGDWQIDTTVGWQASCHISQAAFAVNVTPTILIVDESHLGTGQVFPVNGGIGKSGLMQHFPNRILANTQARFQNHNHPGKQSRDSSLTHSYSSHSHATSIQLSACSRVHGRLE